MDILFQAGLVIGMLQGVYEGDVDFKTLAQQGDIGLGTLNGVDGEMVAVDGHFYRIDVNGVAELIPPEQCTPFAVVSQFQPVPSFTIDPVESLAALNALLDSHIATPNIFYMIRIEAELEWIKLRSESCQMRPYQPLAETLPKLQHTFELTHSTGTLVVTRCPDYSAAFTVPHYHYHYINHDRTTGGHVFDLKLRTAKVMINPLRQFHMILFNNASFDKANFNIDIQDAISKVELKQ